MTRREKIQDGAENLAIGCLLIVAFFLQITLLIGETIYSAAQLLFQQIFDSQPARLAGDVLEALTAIVEKVIAKNITRKILTAIALIAPLFFYKTVYNTYFGPPEVLAGFAAERSTWLVITVSDAAALLAALPARKEGRIMQLVMFLWTLAMVLVYIATIVLV